MERLPRIVGKEVAPEKAQALHAELAVRRAEARESLHGEYEKTQEDLALISRIEGAINRQLLELGIEGGKEISPSQVHLLTHGAYEHRFPGHEARAVTAPVEGVVYIDLDSVSDEMLAHTLTHELTHVVQETALRQSGGELSTAKVGYQGSNTNDPHEHFRGLNEAITEKFSYDIGKESGWEVDEHGEAKIAYLHYVDIVDTIVEKIAQHTGRPSTEVWKQFLRGAFTGEMMHLREVEKVFGKGSLRVLAAIESGTTWSDEVAVTLFKQYFAANDEETREALAYRILNDKELKAYEHRRSATY